MPTIGFEMTEYVAMENNSVTTEVCARFILPPSLEGTFTVMFRTSDGSAQGISIAS